MIEGIDSKLIKRCIDNDRRAHNELYKLLFSFLMNICMRYKKDYDEAGAALNAIFFKIVVSLPDYNHEKSILPWVKTIAIRLLIDEYRKNSTRLEMPMDIVEVESEAYTAHADESIRAADIVEMIQQLPGVTKEVFNLYVIDGFQHKEIGEMLNMSEGTSKWYLSKARKELQLALKNEARKVLKTRAI